MESSNDVKQWYVSQNNVDDDAMSSVQEGQMTTNIVTPKMQLFETTPSLKHAVYNLLVDYFNNMQPDGNEYKEWLVKPYQDDGKSGFCFRDDHKYNGEILMAEIFAMYVKKSDVNVLRVLPEPFRQDLYRYYLRATTELLSKYFQKVDQFTYLCYDVPLFVPNASIEEANYLVRMEYDRNVEELNEKFSNWNVQNTPKFGIRGKKICKCIEVTSGDSCKLIFFEEYNKFPWQIQCRMWGYCSPKKKNAEEEEIEGFLSTAVLESLIEDKVVVAEFFADEKYGRTWVNIYVNADYEVIINIEDYQVPQTSDVSLADVYNTKELLDVNDFMLNNTFSSEYFEEKKKSFEEMKNEFEQRETNL